MSGGSGSRVSIPNNMKRTIHDIKEITGNHSDDEIYAMLKECSMDPNETTQRLLLQDTFHEVKRKREKRKENAMNREPAESRWRPGVQGRGSRGARGNFSSRYVLHDAGGGKNSGIGRDIGASPVSDKGVSASMPAWKETKDKEKTAAVSSAAIMANGPSTSVHTSNVSAGTGVNLPEVSSATIGTVKIETTPSPVEAVIGPSIAYGTGGMHGQPVPTSNPSSTSAVCFSSSDPMLVPSNDARHPGAVGTIKREVGSHRISASEIGSSFIQGKMPNKSQGVLKNQPSESSQPSAASAHTATSISRPPSNYSNRSQEAIGSLKVSNKEWKPKSVNPNPNAAQASGSAGTSEVSTIPVEASAQSQPASSVLNSEEVTTTLQKKLGDLHIRPRQHVILPNHIHVPESERTKLSFGSFDASFVVTCSIIGAPESDKSPTPVSETSQVVEEVEEPDASYQHTLQTAEAGGYPDQPESSVHVQENLSGEDDVAASAVTEYNEAKQDNSLLPGGGPQYSMVHTSPNYNFGFVPPIIGNQFAAFENSESQVRDASRLPSFVVQQPFDPANYYAQFYRSGADGDGRVSPFQGGANKYNGNVAVLPPQTSQSPQEGGNSLVMSTTGPTPLVTQAAGLMQSSVPVPQQPFPVFRPPAGVHISHYPPNYIPYGHYFSPFYGPPPAIQQFLSNGAFPQQPQAGGVYPTPQAAAAAGAKFSLPHYKPGTNTGNSTHIGMPSGYGPYGSSPAGYNPSSAATAGNSNTNEDLGGSQFKENNVYMSGQQSEGLGVWIDAPGRDISNLPASSFYNLPPQGQHVTFAPTQAGHGTFASIYHPAQAVSAASVHPLLQQSQTIAGALDMGGAPAGNVYQQPQHAHVNWPSNY